MKGYAVFLLIVACVLMLLPIPALPRAQAKSVETVATPEATPSPQEPSLADTALSAVRILTGDTVTQLSVREFLIRTLAFEMPPTYHAEALKAQAVAAYTYYGRRQRTQAANPDPALKGAHFTAPDSTFPQEYTADKLRERWGEHFDTYYDALCTAVDAVLGRYVTYQDEWIDACYFAISHGSTEEAKVVWGNDVPYLRAVASPADTLADGYETTVTLSAEQMKTALLAHDKSLSLGNDPAAWFGEPTLSAAGSVASIPVGGKALGGTAVRKALSLRSAAFAVAFADGQFTITVHGYGHGVGMSQYGANALALQGYSWQEILQCYYTGVCIV
jgi:stage II sporulation protein D